MSKRPRSVLEVQKDDRITIDLTLDDNEEPVRKRQKSVLSSTNESNTNHLADRTQSLSLSASEQKTQNHVNSDTTESHLKLEKKSPFKNRPLWLDSPEAKKNLIGTLSKAANQTDTKRQGEAKHISSLTSRNDGSARLESTQKRTNSSSRKTAVDDVKTAKISVDIFKKVVHTPSLKFDPNSSSTTSSSNIQKSGSRTPVSSSNESVFRAARPIRFDPNTINVQAGPSSKTNTATPSSPLVATVPKHGSLPAKNVSSSISGQVPTPSQSKVIVNIPPSRRVFERKEMVERLQKGTDFAKQNPGEVERVLGVTGFSECLTKGLDKPKVVKIAQPKKRRIDRSKVVLDLGTSARQKRSEITEATLKIVHPRDQAKAVLADRFLEHFDPPLTFSSEVNDHRLNGKFQFVSNYVLRKGVKAVGVTGLAGCHCPGLCDISCQCLHKYLDDEYGRRVEQVQSYERRPDGLVVLTDSYINHYSKRAEITECNEQCGCDQTCPNRLVQKGRKVPLEVFETRLCGFGVRSSQPLIRGQFIELYLGEVITENELTRREDASEEGASSYVYSLDWFPASQHYHVDGENFGSAMRFVNHSCNPNARTFTVLNHKSTKQLHYVAFFAIKDIPPGTEITIDYTPQDAGKKYDPSEQDDDLTKCLCGEKNCRKQLWRPGKQRRTRRRILGNDVD